jgi:hypothetical protein
MQKDLRNICLLFLDFKSLLRLEITPLCRGTPTFTYLDEGAVHAGLPTAIASNCRPHSCIPLLQTEAVT